MKICLKPNFLILISIVLTAVAQGGGFTLMQDNLPVGPIYTFHSKYLGIGTRYALPEVVPPWLRMPELKTPGDYYRHPAGADETKLEESEILEIKNALSSIIGNEYYDSYVLNNLKGYAYELFKGDIKRREYYVKYSNGDTIYVISGLLGEFLSFYRAIPGKDVISIDQLKREAAKLSPSIKFSKDVEFIKKHDDRIYFVEYLDRDQKLRVRNYQIVEYRQESDKNRDNPYGKYYNLIEITKFLDEEAMP